MKNELRHLWLCCKVLTIKPSAVPYLLFGVRKQKEFRVCGRLIETMVWSKTRQGHSYWSRINKKLRGYNA